MKPGSLIRMLPMNYGTIDNKVSDQWSGLIGILTNRDDEGLWYTALVRHPDDDVPHEIMLRRGQFYVIDEEHFKK